MLEIEKLNYDDKGLIPAVVQDYGTKKVLMMAWMNQESLEISLREKRTCFYSRSRRELWRKGETSGNVQHIVSVSADCDMDTLIVEVKADGPACHTGEETCFFQPLFEDEERRGAMDRETFGLDQLYELVAGRKTEVKEDSYTSYLFQKGLDKILKKVGEECTEVVIAAKGEDREETVFEVADLAYHVLVLMVEMGISVEDILAELGKRHVVDHKVKQEHMQ